MSEQLHGAEAVGAGFDQAADSYAEILTHNLVGARRLVGALPEARYDSIIDVGCGTGFASLEMIGARGTRRVLGVDASAGMMDVFRQRAEGLDASVVLQVADATHLPAADASVDAVISTMAFHWFPDKPAALAEMARTVRPGGVVAILTAGRGTDDELNDAMRSMDPPVPAAWTGVFDHIHRDVREMQGMLRDVGLDPVDVWSETRVRTTSVESYIGRLQAVASHLSSDLTPEEAQGHGERLAAELASRSTPDGFEYTFVKLFAIARRPGG